MALNTENVCETNTKMTASGRNKANEAAPSAAGGPGELLLVDGSTLSDGISKANGVEQKREER